MGSKALMTIARFFSAAPKEGVAAEKNTLPAMRATRSLDNLRHPLSGQYPPFPMRSSLLPLLLRDFQDHLPATVSRIQSLVGLADLFQRQHLYN